MDHPLLKIVCKTAHLAANGVSEQEPRRLCKIPPTLSKTKHTKRVTLGMVCQMADDVNGPPENARTR
eukprot:6878086-Lingulodinium_polyedra.AAC.1